MKKYIILAVVALLLLASAVYFYYASNMDLFSEDPTISKIKERGVLIVGSDIPYGVMEYFDASGKPAGIDVDIAQEIANSLDVELEFKDYDWDNLFVVLKSGEIDVVVSSITITEERGKEMLFSTPYFSGGQVIVTDSDHPEFKSMQDLAAKNIGVQEESTSDEFARKYLPEEQVFRYPSVAEIISSFKSGETDAFIIDYIAAIDEVKKDPSLRITSQPLTQEYYGIATKLGNEKLVDIFINSKLRDLKRTGRLDEIKNKYGA